MAVTQTSRLGIYRWSGGADPFTRQQLDASHSSLEDRAAIFLSGLGNARPTASASNVRGFYLATDTNILYYCAPDGAGYRWVSVTAFAAPIGTLTPGGSASAGSAETAARSDHSHAMLPFAGTATIAQIGTEAAAGDSNTYARGNHVHVLANGSVTAGKIAAGGVSASNQFAAGVVDTAAIGTGQVSRDRIAASERIPVGTIMTWLGVGTSAPTGWVLCDGVSTVPIGSDLGAVLGTRFNLPGDSTTLARVPDLRGKFVRGAAATTTNGTAVGSDTVTLSVDQMPPHTHAAGNIAVANHADHYHAPGTLGTQPANIEHRHTIAHDHSVTVSTIDTGPVLGRSTGYGALLGPGAGATIYGWVRNGSTDPGSSYDPVASTVTNWNVPGIDVVAKTTSDYSGYMSANATTHAHGLTGATSAPVSSTGTATPLTHTVTGTSGGVTGQSGTQSTVSTVPASITVNYIIKA